MKVNEIFYSLQGEGRHAGRPAVFIRLSGCNLKCPFCDTDFKENTEMTEQEIVDEVKKIAGDCYFVVITGGEPTIQNCVPLIDLLHKYSFYVAMETNGTRQVPENVDWVTISPKQAYVGPVGSLFMKSCDELKVVFDAQAEVSDYGVRATLYYLQPCDTGNAEENKKILDQCVEYIKANPKWMLSLQTQKIINVR